jgi:hypothetical protein
MERVRSAWETPMFFGRVPSAVFDGFNFCDEERIVGEGDRDMIRWVIYSKDSYHKATPLFYEVYKERNLRCVSLMQNIIMVKYVNWFFGE